MLRHIALVSRTRHVALAEAARVAAALQKQIAHDASPLWGLEASLSVFAALRDVPVGYWPILIVDDIHDPNAAGFHVGRQGQPYALIEYGPSWSLSASHESLEMLIDPSGNRQVSGPSPAPDQGEVNFLVEVCDPSADAQFGYSIDGVLLSDFCTPAYFDHSSAGGRYSFTGAIKAPLEVLKNGYLSWYEPISKTWFQQQFFGSAPRYIPLGAPGEEFRCLREFTNRGEVDHRRLSHVSSSSLAMREAADRFRQHSEAARSAAESMDQEIVSLGRRLNPEAARGRARRG
jgi:hypothetical protein